MERASMNQGPEWLREALSDRTATDICINGSKAAFIDRGNGLEPLNCEPAWNDSALRGWVLDQLASVEKTWDARYPFVDATLPSGHRMHVAFPPLSTGGILVSLRRLATRAGSEVPWFSGFSRWGESPATDLLLRAVLAGDSILISGATGSGKTTLAGDLLELVPKRERIVALEDTPELAPRHPHYVNLLSRPPNADGFGEVTLRALFRQALRMRPDRIILGECRGAEVLELLQALNSGHRGALATLHANSPRDALRRIELLCLLAAGNAITPEAIRELLSVGIQWIVQVVRAGPLRRISEIARLEGREGDTILLRPVVQKKA